MMEMILLALYRLKKLMDYIFDHYKIKEITAKNKVSKITRVKIDDGEKKSALVYMKKPTKLWLPKEQKISNLKVKFSKSALQAPLTKNEKSGRVLYFQSSNFKLITWVESISKTRRLP